MKNVQVKPHPFVRGFKLLPKYFGFLGISEGLHRLAHNFIYNGVNGVARHFQVFNTVEKVELLDEGSLKYIIFAPDYVPNSAGIFCLYNLCESLNKKGQKSAVVGSILGHPDFKTPLIGFNKARKIAKQGKVFVVYPETVKGNPLRAKNVIRWVLNRPGLLGGDEVYPENEVVFLYSNVYRSYVKNKVTGMLYMPTLDQKIFYPPAGQEARPLACYYVGKSDFQSGYFDPDTTFEIRRDSPAKKELGKLFRASKILYCFDNSTALIYESIACGCPVVVIPDGTQTWEDFKKLELGVEGIHWGAQSTPLAPCPSDKLREKILSAKAEFSRQLDHLIKSTQR